MLIGVESSLIVIAAILLKLKDKLSYISILLFALIISIPDLYYIPTNFDDLYKYFQEMHLVQSCTNISSLFNAYHTIPQLVYHEHSYVYNIFQWLISRNGNYALLAFCSVGIVYFCISLPAFHLFIVNKCNVKQLFSGLIIVISLFPYYNASSTLRWYIAVSIFYLLLFININYNKLLITIPFYLMLIYIHSGLLIPVLITIFCFIFKNVHISLYVYTTLEIILLVIIYVFSHLSIQGSTSLLSVFQSYNSQNYLTYNGGLYNSILFFATFFISYFLLYLGHKIISINYKFINLKLEIKIVILFTLVDLSLLPNILVSARYSIFIGLISVLIYLKVLYYEGFIPRRIKYEYVIIALLYFCLTTLTIYNNMNFNFNQINYNGICNIINF